MKAGLSESVITMLARWESPTILRYARKVALTPSIADSWAFYNPVGMANCYGRPPGSGSSSSSSGAPPAKKQKP